MQPEEYAKIKVTGTAQGCAEVLRELSKKYQVVTTSPIIEHPNDGLAHQYAQLYEKEA